MGKILFKECRNKRMDVKELRQTGTETEQTRERETDWGRQMETHREVEKVERGASRRH